MAAASREPLAASCRLSNANALLTLNSTQLNSIEFNCTTNASQTRLVVCVLFLTYVHMCVCVCVRVGEVYYVSSWYLQLHVDVAAIIKLYMKR